MPRVAVATLAFRLLSCNYNCSEVERGSGVHGGVDGREVVDAAARKGGLDEIYADHRLVVAQVCNLRAGVEPALRPEAGHNPACRIRSCPTLLTPAPI